MVAFMAPLAASAATSAGLSSFLPALSSAGSFLSGLGSIGSIFGGSKKGPSLRDQAIAGAVAEDMLFDTRMDNAAQHGFHPLAMLGMPPMGGGGFAIGGDSGPSKMEKMAEMGQGISRAASAFTSREEREMAKLSAQLGLENQALQNDRLRSEIALLHAPGSPPGHSSMPDPRYPGQTDLPLGVSGASPRYLPVVNPDGSITRVTNPDSGDNELLMLWDMVTATIPDELKNMFRRDVKKLRQPNMKFSKGRR